MNRVLCIIPLGFLACVTLLCGGLYFYFVGGVCIFLIFIILIELCCTTLHSGECKRWRRSFPGPKIRSWLDKGKTWCSLCRAMVKNEAWDEHRTTCASEHAEQLEQMGNYYDRGPKWGPDHNRGPKWGPKICPKCEKLMKVWPEAPLWNEFQCANNRMCRQSEGGAVENRCEPPWVKFSCFLCDINYCGACVRDETTTTNNPQPSEAEETILDITTDDLDPIPLVPTVDDQESHFHNINNQDDLPRSDIPRTQNPGSIPWVPSAPPDDTKSDNDNMNLPSYQESIAP